MLSVLDCRTNKFRHLSYSNINNKVVITSSPNQSFFWNSTADSIKLRTSTGIQIMVNPSNMYTPVNGDIITHIKTITDKSFKVYE